MVIFESLLATFEASAIFAFSKQLLAFLNPNHHKEI